MIFDLCKSTTQENIYNDMEENEIVPNINMIHIQLTHT